MAQTLPLFFKDELGDRRVKAAEALVKLYEIFRADVSLAKHLGHVGHHVDMIDGVHHEASFGQPGEHGSLRDIVDQHPGGGGRIAQNAFGGGRVEAMAEVGIFALGILHQLFSRGCRSAQNGRVNQFEVEGLGALPLSHQLIGDRRAAS